MWRNNQDWSFVIFWDHVLEFSKMKFVSQKFQKVKNKYIHFQKLRNLILKTEQQGHGIYE